MTAHGTEKYLRDLYSVKHTRDEENLEGRFGRLFGHDIGGPHPGPAYKLEELGKQGGAMDEGLSTTPTGNSDIPAGYTFLGQFIDHDITLDPVSKLDEPADPAALFNFRTPSLDLDCVYGAGPDATPALYVPTAQEPNGYGGKLVIGQSSDPQTQLDFDDLPRIASTDTAVIGDPRNDENIIVSQLQLVFLKFHNKVLDAVSGNFEEARDTVVHYYHRLIVEDFLPRIVGPDLVEKIYNNGRHYYFPHGFGAKPDRPFMPVEFSVAAYRYGHSQVRAFYDLNDNQKNRALFELGGFQRPQTHVDWKYLFQTDRAMAPAMARKIDTQLPGVLMNLPPRVAANPSSLAARNLLRGRIFRLPSGQSIARKMLVDALIQPAQVLDPDANVTALGMQETPLWYYVLQEAQALGNAGNQLGPVGGRIVAEVLLGLIEHYRERTGHGLDYIPTLTIAPANGGSFQMVDLLGFVFSP